jgi:hypothetical protein
MENKNLILGKIDKKVVYLNNGQYGYYLTLTRQIIKSLIGCLMIKWTLRLPKD